MLLPLQTHLAAAPTFAITLGSTQPNLALPPPPTPRHLAYRKSSLKMPKPLPVFNTPSVKRVRYQYDGETSYLDEMQRHASLVTELKTRLHVAKTASDPRLTDKVATDLKATMNVIKDPINNASQSLQVRITDMESTMSQIRDDINDLDTYGPEAMGMKENRDGLISSFDCLIASLRDIFPDLDRAQNSALCKKIADLEGANDTLARQLDDQKRKNIANKSVTMQAMQRRIEELSADAHKLGSELQASDSTNARLEAELEALKTLHHQELADKENRISRVVNGRSQLRRQVESLQASIHTLSASVGSSALVEHLQGELKEARSDQQALRSEIETAGREQGRLEERIRTMQHTSSALESSKSSLAQELNSLTDDHSAALESIRELRQEVQELHADKMKLQDKLGTMSESESKLKEDIRRSSEALASQKRHLEEIADEQINATSSQLILVRLRVDELEALLEARDDAMHKAEEEHAETVCDLMKQVDTAKSDADDLAAKISEQTNYSAELRLQILQTRQNLTRLRWLAITRSVHLEVKTARIDSWMHLCLKHRQMYMDCQRAWARQVAEQYEGEEVVPRVRNRAGSGLPSRR